MRYSSIFGGFFSQKLCANGGHRGSGKWMQTMCLVEFEIDPGSSTYSSCHSRLECTMWKLSDLHISPEARRETSRRRRQTRNLEGTLDWEDPTPVM